MTAPLIRNPNGWMVLVGHPTDIGMLITAGAYVVKQGGLGKKKRLD